MTFDCSFARWDLLNFISDKLEATSYLEIGVGSGETLSKICCPVRVGVDPDPCSAATHISTSDEFFIRNKMSFDLVFIDGLHTSVQVLRDVCNATAFLRKNGIIVLHDCLPLREDHQMRQPKSGYDWTGNVWRAYCAIQPSAHDRFIVDGDWDCGVLIGVNLEKLKHVQIASLDWHDFLSMRVSQDNPLNIISSDEYMKYSNRVLSGSFE